MREYWQNARRNKVSSLWNGGRYDIEIEIMKALTDYTEEVAQEIEAAAGRRAKEAVQTLKETSPRSKESHPHYADGWAIRKKKSGGHLEITIYNRRKPHLTHLLEFGYLKKGGTRVKDRPHITPVQEQLNRDFAADCEEIIKNA